VATTALQYPLLAGVRGTRAVSLRRTATQDVSSIFQPTLRGWVLNIAAMKLNSEALRLGAAAQKSTREVFGLRVWA
jgi:hypothetical protein